MLTRSLKKYSYLVSTNFPANVRPLTKKDVCEYKSPNLDDFYSKRPRETVVPCSKKKYVREIQVILNIKMAERCELKKPRIAPRPCRIGWRTLWDVSHTRMNRKLSYFKSPSCVPYKSALLWSNEHRPQACSLWRRNIRATFTCLLAQLNWKIWYKLQIP